MDISSQTVLITGGASGIGWALAERFFEAGSRVIICGRREEKLREAQRKHPQLDVRVCDVAREDERVALFEWATRAHPGINVLVNNAGIQRRTPIGDDDWDAMREEILINLHAPIHLSMLFARHLRNEKNPAIVNVTSGLAFVPLTMAAVYSATKAALHSFTLSLRHQLADSGIKVIEVIPPAVNTDLGGAGLHTAGVPLEEFADAVMKRLAAGDIEIPYGFAAQSSQASRAELDAIFTRMNARR
jgi:uncharacterized oxidoreductase